MSRNLLSRAKFWGKNGLSMTHREKNIALQSCCVLYESPFRSEIQDEDIVAFFRSPPPLPSTSSGRPLEFALSLTFFHHSHYSFGKFVSSRATCWNSRGRINIKTSEGPRGRKNAWFEGETQSGYDAKRPFRTTFGIPIRVSAPWERANMACGKSFGKSFKKETRACSLCWEI